VQELGRSSPRAADSLKAAQREWLNERNRCGADRGCLLNTYAQRLGALSTAPTSHGGPAGMPQPGVWPGGSSPIAKHPGTVPSAPALAPEKQHGAIDLRTLENPPPGLRPIAFRYHDGLPLAMPASMHHLTALMGAAHKAPAARGDCHLLKTTLFTDE